VTCSGPTFEFISRTSIEDEEFILEDQPYEAYENPISYEKKRVFSSRPAKVIVNTSFYTG